MHEGPAAKDIEAMRENPYLQALAAQPAERYRALFEHNPVPMWMVDGETSAFLLVNAAAVALYGYSREELGAMTVAHVWPDATIAQHRKQDGSLLDVEVVESEMVVEGKAVRLYVITKATERLHAAVAAEQPLTIVTSSDATRRALVADDDPHMRAVVVRLLKKAGFEVVDVDSGFRAIGALEAQPFDVVVSDVQMPDGGGLDLLRAVRRVDLDVPVILMTGAPSVTAAASAVEYGAFRYLTKPLDNQSFLKTVDLASRAHALARIRREAYNVTGQHGGVTDRAGLEVRFDAALATLWMAFQPIVHAKGGALYGVEALMRSTEPSLPDPGAVLDAATELNRLPLIGRKIRGLSAAVIASRSDATTLFVNLHPQDLYDPDLVDVNAPLTKIAHRVILEVTERASLDTSPALSEKIARLRELGFRLAVDDIGAGYSGLTSFTELMPEIVKIDMSLVRDVHKSALKQRTISALCRLCRDVGTLVVGEGIEIPEERDTLAALGCDLLQGYLLGRPNRDIK